MLKIEGEINNYIEILDSFEKKDQKLFNEIMAKRKFEIKRKNQEKMW